MKIGTVIVPEGERGPWKISKFEVADDIDTTLFNMRAIRDGDHEMCVRPGSYVRLTHKERGVIMSNTPMEVRTNIDAIHKANGAC